MKENKKKVHIISEINISPLWKWVIISEFIIIGFALFIYSFAYQLSLENKNYIILAIYTLIMLGISFLFYLVYILYIKFAKDLNITLTSNEIIIPEFDIILKNRKIKYSKIQKVYVSEISKTYELFKKYKAYIQRLGYDMHYKNFTYNQWKNPIYPDDKDIIYIEYINNNKSIAFYTLHKSKIKNLDKFLDEIDKYKIKVL